MASIHILGHEVAIEFKEGHGAQYELKEEDLLHGVAEMARLINGLDQSWNDAERKAFRSIHKIVFFTGKVEVNGYLMDRPCCDEDDAIFYWEAEEFDKNSDADVRANTFFHDCWHVVQFRQARNRFAADEQERLSREVDAIDRQIEVARKLGNSPEEIKFLERFRGDQQAIKDRLEEGVESRLAPHQPGEFSLPRKEKRRRK